MKITILGSGSFISSLDHFGPSYLLEADGKKILIDAGQGCSIQLLKLGIKPEDLDYIFITHFHADHVLDLAALILSRKISSRWKEIKHKIKIIGQIGTREKITEILGAFCDSAEDFYDVIEIDGSLKLEKLEIKSFKVVHKDLDAIAYRITENGKVLVFSGDTILCDGIKLASQNANLLIADASLPKDMENNIHMNSTQIGILCAKSEVKKVVLSHLTHWVEGRDIISEVKEKYKGEVIVGKDLMQIDI